MLGKQKQWHRPDHQGKTLLPRALSMRKSQGPGALCNANGFSPGAANKHMAPEPGSFGTHGAVSHRCRVPGTALCVCGIRKMVGNGLLTASDKGSLQGTQESPPALDKAAPAGEVESVPSLVLASSSSPDEAVMEPSHAVPRTT